MYRFCTISPESAALELGGELGQQMWEGKAWEVLFRKELFSPPSSPEMAQEDEGLWHFQKGEGYPRFLLSALDGERQMTSALEIIPVVLTPGVSVIMDSGRSL